MSLRRAVVYAYLDRYASYFVMFVSSVVTARLLTPAEIGVFSVTMVLVGFLGPFRDLGASQYVIQTRELKPEALRAVWAVQIGMAFLLALLLLAARGPVAAFYRAPQIETIMLLLAVSSMLLPPSAMVTAWLSREMAFGRLALIRFGGAFFGAVVSIVLAWLGHGALSLAWGALAGTLFSSLVATLLRPALLPWRPGLRGVRDVLGFGSVMTGISIANIAFTGLPELILGRTLGLASSAMFGRAQTVVSIVERMVLQGTYSVALPMFAQRVRDGGDVAALYLRTLSMVSGLAWTLLFGLAILAEPVVRLLYGAQWGDAVPLVVALSVAMAVQLPALLMTGPLLALGQHHRVLWLTLANLVLQAVAAIAGSAGGLLGVGLAVAGASVVILGLWLALALPGLQVGAREFAATVARSLALAAATASVPGLLWLLSDRLPDTLWSPVVLSVGLGVPMFAVVAWRLSHPLWQELRHAAGPRLARRS